MATQVGKSIMESAGVLARRAAGRRVPASTGAAGQAELARVLVRGAGSDPGQARALAALMGAVPAVAAARGVPQLLPASTRYFRDRQDPLKLLDRELARPFDGRPRIANPYGPAGIGCTAMAVHWGWQQHAQFPDGQLYADLRGEAAGRPVAPETVLHRFLLRLGVAEDAIPTALDELIDRYRTVVADRRLLVVLDNVHSAAQVRPLLTSAPGNFMIVISRRSLVALAGLDVVPVPVGPLPGKDAQRLLGDLVGKQALKEGRAALPSLLERCAGSPWALRALAPELLGPSPQVQGADEPADPLESLYRALPPDLSRAYRLLALRPWPVLRPAAVGVMLGLTESSAGVVLSELAARHLLEPAEGGYVYRPAVRLHALAAAERLDGGARCAEVVRRAVADRLEFAAVADQAALAQRWRLEPAHDPQRPQRPSPYANQGEALAALLGELDNLVEAVFAAESLGDAESVCYLCQALWPVLLKAGRSAQVLPAMRAGVRAADGSFPKSPMAGRMHAQLGLGLAALGGEHAQEAEDQLRAAAEADREAGHLRGQSTATDALGLLRLGQFDYESAGRLFEEADRLLDGIGAQDPGFADVPRARALAKRNRGRALRGLLRPADARQQLTAALESFRALGDAYNEARTLTDLADTSLDQDDFATARPLVGEAVALLEAEHAEAHLVYLYALRDRCLTAAG